jgi:hypothetical protein
VVLRGISKPNPVFELVQARSDIVLDLTAAAAHVLVFMSHPESLEVGMNAILSEPRKTVATEHVKTCFGRRRGLGKLDSSQEGKTIMRKERRKYGNVLPSKTIRPKKTRRRRAAAESDAGQ